MAVMHLGLLYGFPSHNDRSKMFAYFHVMHFLSSCMSNYLDYIATL